MQALVVAAAARAASGQPLHAKLAERHERALLPQVGTAARQRHPTAVRRRLLHAGRARAVLLTQATLALVLGSLSHALVPQVGTAPAEARPVVAQ